MGGIRLTEGDVMANRLANSSSAYLKSAAHQPIDWHEFGPEAFQLAKEQDKPVLLDIGAVWCHWCHVIDRESYDDPGVAELINQYYIPIKVDRDQRPDVDARYQQVVQAMSGQGGWPLTAFLTYDGRLIYGGTYFPQPAMKNLLERIQEIYHERKQEIFNEQDMLTPETIRRMDPLQGGSQEPPAEEISPLALRKLCEDFLESVLASTVRAYDGRNGGFGSQPKFAHFSTLEYLIAHLNDVGNGQDSRQHLEIVEKTLTEMARGGIYDQVAGGFHRYSVDDHWHVPHFEKMAHDNAEALKVYTQAYRLTGIPFFRETAESIIGWVNALLSDQTHGGFYASQDADIDLSAIDRTDDGDHFTWSPEEIREVLTPQEMETVARYYDIHEHGDMHHAAGRNVLYIAKPLTQIAQELSIPLSDAEELLASARRKMLIRRQERPLPFVDKTLYVNWNGMLTVAYFEAADLLDLPDVRDFAEKTLERILSAYYRKGEAVFHTDGIEGFLEDYAWLGMAALRGYQSTENAYYLTVAQDIGELLLSRFEDQRLGAFYDTADSEDALGLLQFKRKPAEDNPNASPNAIALQLLLSLYHLTDDARYLKSFEKGLNLLIHLNGNYGLYVSALALNALLYLNPPLKLEVAGDNHALKAAARHVFFPGKLLSYKPEELPAEEVRICVGTQCLAPVRDAASLAEQVKTLCSPAAQTASD